MAKARQLCSIPAKGYEVEVGFCLWKLLLARKETDVSGILSTLRRRATIGGNWRSEQSEEFATCKAREESTS